MRLSVRVADYAARAVPRSVTLRMRRSAGLTRLVRGTLDAVVPDDLSEVEVATGQVAGARMLLDLHREKSYWAGTYQPWVQDTLAELLAGGGVAWDIGAYVGYHTLLFHRLCGPQRVVAVEPNPEIRERLEVNLRLNHVLGVEVVAGAVGSAPGTGALIRHHDPSDSTVAGRRVPGATPVSLTTLDHMLASFPAPTVVKMNIEGGEADALAGAGLILRAVRPRFIVELHKRRGIAAMTVLRTAGYRLLPIDHAGDVGAELRRGGTRHVLAEPDS